MDCFIGDLYESFKDANVISKLTKEDFENLEQVEKTISQMKQILDKV